MVPSKIFPDYKIWNKTKNEFLKGVDVLSALCQRFSIDFYTHKIHDDLVWLESSGIRTKSGEKIYDGDIVSGKNTDGGYGPEAIHFETLGVVSFSEIYDKWIVTEIGSEEVFDLYDYCLADKIIGNIYEHSNLLNIEI